MKKTRLYKVNKFLGQTLTGGKCPEIRWDEVTRVEAFGTDVVGAFAIVITFFYKNGTQTRIHPEQRGYYKIIESLGEHYSEIAEDWFTEMQKAYEGWRDVHRILYSSQKENLSK